MAGDSNRGFDKILKDDYEKEKKLRCPYCDKYQDLEKFQVFGKVMNNKILYDKCPICDMELEIHLDVDKDFEVVYIVCAEEKGKGTR